MINSITVVIRDNDDPEAILLLKCDLEHLKEVKKEIGSLKNEWSEDCIDSSLVDYLKDYLKENCKREVIFLSHTVIDL